MSSLSGSKIIDLQHNLYANYRPARSKGNRRNVSMVVEDRRRSFTGDVECLECGVKLLALSSHLYHVHGLTTKDYRRKHGDAAKLVNDELQASRIQRAAIVNWERNRWVVCSVCGVKFSRVKRGHRNKTCSRLCRYKLMASHKLKYHEKTCKLCGTAFRVSREQVYCSTKCSAKDTIKRRLPGIQQAAYRSHAAAQRRRIKICAQCKSPFRSRRANTKTCSYSCRNAFFSIGFK